MRKGKLERNLSAILYDKQLSGKKLLKLRKSFQEVAQTLQNDRKK